MLALSMLAAINGGSSSALAGDDSDALLDECIAGIQANLALIQHGTASYRLKTWHRKPRTEKPREWRLKVEFDLPKRHFEWQDEEIIGGRQRTVVDHTISGPSRVIRYRPALGGLRLPSANIARITRPRASRAKMEPAQQRQNGWGDPPSFAREIAYMRRTAPDHVVARRGAGGLIEIFFDPPSGEHKRARAKGRYWLSPEQGYALVRLEEWLVPWEGREPNCTYEAEFRQANNGAYVVERRHERTRMVENGALAPWLEEELWLEEIDLLAAPKETAFALEGLNLPVGAPVRNQINGREYRYGVDAIDENEIDVGQPAGPMSLRSLLNALNGVAGALFLIWAGRRLGRLCDRRSRGESGEKIEKK